MFVCVVGKRVDPPGVCQLIHRRVRVNVAVLENSVDTRTNEPSPSPSGVLDKSVVILWPRKQRLTCSHSDIGGF